ncbi:Lrp/AsnC family transcriptional regulator [Sphingorhabdus sp.]|uniref:Lrp/AsnC family transcriptional regulator n=1 Tax=Sphingorhabdus sp. TaxID=1902408 RepID=UPI003593935C
MNRSRYVTRQIDSIDRAIIAALTEDGRMSAKDLAAQMGLSSPTIGDRILKLKDAGAIVGYSVLIDPAIFGLKISAYIKIEAMPGALQKVAEIIDNTHQVVEAHRVTGSDGFVTRVLVRDMEELETVVDRFVLFASTCTSIVQSTIVPRRLPKL